MTVSLLIFLTQGGDTLEKAMLFNDASQYAEDIAIEDIASLNVDTVIAVLAGEDVSTWPLQLPPLSDAKLMQILPAQLEDLKAMGQVTDHYALMKRSADNVRVVASVSESVMERALKTISEASLTADLLIPDYALISVSSATTVVTAPLGADRFIVRMPDGTGFAGNRLVASAITDISEARPLAVSVNTLSDAAEFNLLQGRYKPRLALAVYLPLFRRAGAIAIVTVVVWCIGMFVSAQKLQQEANEVNTKTEALFAQSFPEITRVVDMQAQARRFLSQSAEGQGGNFLRLSERVFSIVSRHSGAIVEGVRYNQDQNAFFVTISLSSFAESDALLSELRGDQLIVTEGGSRQEAGRVITDVAVEVVL